jgi:RNase H-fold protein (predicted Holliday junction resolvase)
MWGFDSLKDILDVVMVPIALALLAPWITRRWQDKQRNSQIKTELVAEISSLVMTTVMTAYLFKTRAKRQSDSHDSVGSEIQELERIYKKWRVATCVIGSKLHAYFPNTEIGDMQIHKKWDRFSEQLTKYYEESRVVNSKVSDEQSKKEKEALFEEKARVIEDILASKITGFSSRASA